MVKNILDYLENSAERLPEKTAVADEKAVFTYKELLEKAENIGAVLSKEISARRSREAKRS